MPASRNGAATAACDAVGVATTTASTTPTSEAGVLDHGRAVRVGDLARALEVRVGHADQIHARHAGENPRVMPSEVPDADDCDALWLSQDLTAHDRDARGIGGLDHGLPVHEQRLARVHRQGGRADLAQHVDGAHADDRHVETHVLLRLGHLHQPQTRPGQVPRSTQHLVGAFHRLDRDDRAVLHGDRLADVERRDGVSHAIAELEVRLFLGRQGRGRSACPVVANSGCSSSVESMSVMP